MTTTPAFAAFHAALSQVEAGLRQHAAGASAGQLGASLTAGGVEALALDPRVLVANAGLVNAGKSSLFNALLDEASHFAVKDARCTRVNREADLGPLVLVDTPGLDADAQDAREAEATFRRADRILFVHSAEQGELDAIEVAFLHDLARHFPPEDLAERLVPVLTKAEAAPEGIDRIEAAVRGQWQAIFGFEPAAVHRIATPTYFKGMAEGKERLVAFSQVPALREALQQAAPALRAAKGRLCQARAGQWIARQVTALEGDLAALKLAQSKREQQARKEQQRLDGGLAELLQAIAARREACRQKG